MAIKTAGDMLALKLLIITAWHHGYDVGVKAHDPDAELPNGDSWADCEVYKCSTGSFQDLAALLPGEGDATDEQRDAIEAVCQAVHDGVLSADSPQAIGDFLEARQA